MPLYEYRCGDCEHKFEMLRSFTFADVVAVCPCCGADRGRRLVSQFAPFRKSASGDMTSSGGRCSGCSATSCATCH